MFFEATIVSGDDLKRDEMYKENVKRIHQQAKFEDYGEYLKSLGMRAVIKPFDSMYISQIAQLTNKSNQFNLTTRRYAQEEIQKLADNRNRITLYGKLEDKFGDYGVVSVIIGQIKGDVCHIDLWIMSCRVLKRDMEYAMMDALAYECSKKEGLMKSEDIIIHL